MQKPKKSRVLMIFVVMAMNIITICRCTSKLHISYDFCI